jgi:hypothetical protein
MMTKEKLPIITMEQIRGYGPCKDPGQFADDNWSGTALDILRANNVTADDKLWVVCREGVLDERTLRIFAVRCAREALALPRVRDHVDPRSVEACDVAERYANGEATAEELDAARDAAWAAARDAALAAARDAARDASLAAARDAAWAAARDAALAAARDAARDAAWDAAIEILVSLIKERYQ